MTNPEKSLMQPISIAIRFYVIFQLLVHLLLPAHTEASDNLIIVIIDGARYSETFGDPAHSYIPRMWNLAGSGTVISNFRNDSLTYTSRAIPALWCGSWTAVRDTFYNSSNTQYALKPTLFEYFRKQKNAPLTDCYYVLKYISSLWLPSFHPNYGPDYWPQLHSVGYSDEDVVIQAKTILTTHHPKFALIYLADVDGAGHGGNWNLYTRAIRRADSLTGVLWNHLQNDAIYQNTTTLFVTNDHGRHDDQHGGFSGHGDGCEGCRHIQFLAIGPDIKSNFVSTRQRRIPDMAVTGAHILGVNPEYATGEIMSEIFVLNSISNKSVDVPSFQLLSSYPNPFNQDTRIEYLLHRKSYVVADIYNTAGEKIITLIDGQQSPGEKSLQWNGKNLMGQDVASGVYLLRIRAADLMVYHKLVLLK